MIASRFLPLAVGVAASFAALTGPTFGAPVITTNVPFNASQGLFIANISAGYQFAGEPVSQFVSTSTPALCLTLSTVTHAPTLVMGTCLAPGDDQYINQLWYMGPIPPTACGNTPCKSLRPLSLPTQCVGKYLPVSAQRPVRFVDCSNSPGPGWLFDFKAPSAFSNE